MSYSILNKQQLFVLSLFTALLTTSAYIDEVKATPTNETAITAGDAAAAEAEGEDEEEVLSGEEDSDAPADETESEKNKQGRQLPDDSSGLIIPQQNFNVTSNPVSFAGDQPVCDVNAVVNPFEYIAPAVNASINAAPTATAPSVITPQAPVAGNAPVAASIQGADFNAGNNADQAAAGQGWGLYDTLASYASWAYNSASAAAGSAGSALKSGANSAYDYAGSKASDAYNAASAAAGSAGSALKSGANSAYDYASSAAGSAYNAAGSAANYAGSKASDAYNAASAAAGSAGSALKSGANSAYDYAGSKASDAYNAASSAAGSAANVAKYAYNNPGDAANYVGSKIAEGASAAHTKLLENPNTKPVADAASAVYNSETATALGSAARSAGSKIGSAANSAYDAAKYAYNNPAEAKNAALLAAGSAVGSAAHTAYHSSPADAVNAAGSAISSAAGSAYNAVKPIGDAAYNDAGYMRAAAAEYLAYGGKLAYELAPSWNTVQSAGLNIAATSIVGAMTGPAIGLGIVGGAKAALIAGTAAEVVRGLGIDKTIAHSIGIDPSTAFGRMATGAIAGAIGGGAVGAGMISLNNGLSVNALATGAVLGGIYGSTVATSGAGLQVAGEYAASAARSWWNSGSNAVVTSNNGVSASFNTPVQIIRHNKPVQHINYGTLLLSNINHNVRAASLAIVHPQYSRIINKAYIAPNMAMLDLYNDELVK